MSYTNGLDNPHLYFQCKLYSGDGSTDVSHTFDGSENMQANMIWFKRRNGSANNFLYDSVRGANRSLVPNDADAEATSGEQTEYLSSFDSDGFTLGHASNNVNGSGQSYVAWAWVESATAGFDIVTYTGNGSNRTISHSLSAIPKFYMIKDRGTTHNWRGYHFSLGATKNISWEIIAAEQSGSNYWQDTAPTSSVFSLGNQNETNQNTNTFVNYLFSEKQGFSKFSSYRGNANSDGVFVMCGFRPSMVWIKRVEGSNHWFIWDKHRDGFNESNEYLKADAAEAESDGVNRINILSNGFKITTSNDGNNAEEKYIFMAWADAPFVNSNGVPCNAR